MKAFFLSAVLAAAQAHVILDKRAPGPAYCSKVSSTVSAKSCHNYVNNYCRTYLGIPASTVLSTTATVTSTASSAATTRVRTTVTKANKITVTSTQTIQQTTSADTTTSGVTTITVSTCEATVTKKKRQAANSPPPCLSAYPQGSALSSACSCVKPTPLTTTVRTAATTTTTRITTLTVTSTVSKADVTITATTQTTVAASTVTVPSSTSTINNEPASCSSPGPNLIQLGDFTGARMDTPGPWVRYNTPFCGDGQGNTFGCFNAGASGGGNGGTISQSVSGTEPGATYILTFSEMVESYDGSYTYSWTVSYAGNVVTSGTFAQEYGWTQHTVRIPNAGDGVLAFTMNPIAQGTTLDYYDEGGWDIDNVEFRKAPGS